ncbi:MAG TPA: zinc ribbon domain-containing protein [Blastocatellia bacterium]|nr:zinc ribbon domain-containing protein [Blastocatellia bacterium]
MYCPTCGANQANDKKFCPACGTNLAVVTAALTGQLTNTSSSPSLAEAQARYRQQIAAAINRGAPGVALLVAALFLLLVFPWGISGWIAFGLIIGGISALGRGVGHYYLARGDLKAAESAAQTSLPAAPASGTLHASSTNPLPPHSVTEHTTRHLG